MKIGEHELGLKALGTVLALLISIGTIAGAAENRYTNKGDFKDYRIQQLENEVFKLDFKASQEGKLTPLDDALKKRYESQIKNIRSE